MSTPPPPPSPTKLRRTTSEQHFGPYRNDYEFNLVFDPKITVVDEHGEEIDDPLLEVDAIKHRVTAQKLNVTEEAMLTLERIQTMEAMDKASPSYKKDRHEAQIDRLWAHLHLLTCQVMCARPSIYSANY